MPVGAAGGVEGRAVGEGAELVRDRPGGGEVREAGDLARAAAQGERRTGRVHGSRAQLQRDGDERGEAAPRRGGDEADGGREARNREGAHLADGGGEGRLPVRAAIRDGPEEPAPGGGRRETGEAALDDRRSRQQRVGRLEGVGGGGGRGRAGRGGRGGDGGERAEGDGDRGSDRHCFSRDEGGDRLLLARSRAPRGVSSVKLGWPDVKRPRTRRNTALAAVRSPTPGERRQARPTPGRDLAQSGSMKYPPRRHRPAVSTSMRVGGVSQRAIRTSSLRPLVSDGLAQVGRHVRVARPVDERLREPDLYRARGPIPNLDLPPPRLAVLVPARLARSRPGDGLPAPAHVSPIAASAGCMEDVRSALDAIIDPAPVTGP